MLFSPLEDAEVFCVLFRKSSGLPHVILLYSSVFQAWSSSNKIYRGIVDSDIKIPSKVQKTHERQDVQN